MNYCDMTSEERIAELANLKNQINDYDEKIDCLNCAISSLEQLQQEDAEAIDISELNNTYWIAKDFKDDWGDRQEYVKVKTYENRIYGLWLYYYWDTDSSSYELKYSDIGDKDFITKYYNKSSKEVYENLILAMKKRFEIA